MNNKFEIITFKDGDFLLPVNVSPLEDTVWLSLNDISKLFEKNKSTISRHINNIFSDGELSKISTVAKSATVQIEGNREIKRDIELFNLDVILSVGYRVNGKRGTLFRQWANHILKQYIFSQTNFSILECKEKIIDLSERISKVEETQKHELTFVKGDKLKGFLSIKRFLETAKQSIYIIDDYFDNSFDEVLREINVNTTIITDPKNILESNEIYKVKKTKSFHDRFIFVDGTGYHLGCSLKDIGNSLTVATRLESIALSDILKFVC